MDDLFWYKISMGIFCLFFIWMLVGYYKAKPDQFSKESLGKSFYSMGILGIVLVAVIAIAVSMLNSG